MVICKFYTGVNETINVNKENMKRSIFLVCFVVFGVVSLSAIGSIVSVAQSGWQTDSISYGISRMVDIASLPC